MSKRAYHRIISGPDIADPFRVLRGVVVINGENDTITVPAGATWPGLAHLPDDLADCLRPDSSEASSDLVLDRQPLTEQDLAFGVTLVRVQLVRNPRMSPNERLDLLAPVADIGEVSVHTLASMIGISRNGLQRARRRILH